MLPTQERVRTYPVWLRNDELLGIDGPVDDFRTWVGIEREEAVLVSSAILWN